MAALLKYDDMTWKLSNLFTTSDVISRINTLSGMRAENKLEAYGLYVTAGDTYDTDDQDLVAAWNSLDVHSVDKIVGKLLKERRIMSST